MALHEVVKEFPVGAGRIKSGTIVDTSEWRNTEALVRARYLRPHIPAPIELPRSTERATRRQGG